MDKNFWGINNDWCYSVQQTADGGYVIAGETSSLGAGFFDVYLIKTDNMGVTIWTKSFGGIDDDFGYYVKQTADGGYIICGSTFSFGTGGYDTYLIKTDANGDSLWTRTYGGIYVEEGTSVLQTSDGGYVFNGYTYNGAGASADIYLVKTDSIGNVLWAKAYGGASDDLGAAIKQTVDGGFIVIGSTGSFGAGNKDVYLIKTDAIGNSVWEKTFGRNNYDYGNSVEQTADEGYIIVVTTQTLVGGNFDSYLIKTDSLGNMLWAKAYGGPNDDGGYSIQQTTDGGYVALGTTASFGTGNHHIYFIKTDSLGNSGCNETNPATIVTTPSTIVSTPATLVTSPPTIVTSPATQVGSGGIVTTLCTTVGVTPISNFNFPKSIHRQVHHFIC